MTQHLVSVGADVAGGEPSAALSDPRRLSDAGRRISRNHQSKASRRGLPYFMLAVT